MTHHLKHRGYRVNRKRTQRLMRLMGIEAIYPKPKHSAINSEHRVYPYLLRDYQVTAANEVWSADITYIPMDKGFMYQPLAATGRRFKAVVRILKRLRNEMADNNYAIAENLPSFLIECLVYNVPNEGLGHDSHIADVRWGLAHLYNNTRVDSDCEEWGEVNELKYLFRPSQPWTRQQANLFLDAAWNYIGFE